MPLTDTAVRQAKPISGKSRKMSDGNGLYLLIEDIDKKYWRWDYRFADKRKTYSIGVYPETTLAEARRLHLEARKLLKEGIDPSQARKAAKQAKKLAAASSFEAVAREWFAKQSPSWAANHSSKIIGRLEKDVFPWLGKRPISEITPQELLTLIQRVESRGAIDTAHRILQNCGQIFRYAVVTGRAGRDIAIDLRGAVAPAKHTHFAAITDPKQAGELLRALDAFQGTFVVRCALQIAPLVFVRPGELRTAQWQDIDLEKAEWRYFITKTKTDHLVSLSKQAVKILQDLRPLTGNRTHVFPGRDPNKPMSEAAINAALRRLGYDTKTEFTAHGFRAMARTLLSEQLRFPSHVIEHQLAHKVPDALGTAYNRTKFLEDRRQMMQAWADYLDELKVGGNVIPLTRTA